MQKCTIENDGDGNVHHSVRPPLMAEVARGRWWYHSASHDGRSSTSVYTLFVHRLSASRTPEIFITGEVEVRWSEGSREVGGTDYEHVSAFL